MGDSLKELRPCGHIKHLNQCKTDSLVFLRSLCALDMKIFSFPEYYQGP